MKFYMKSENIVLVGMTGAGKFTVGKPLSETLIRGFSEGKPQLSLRGAAGDVAIS